MTTVQASSRTLSRSSAYAVRHAVAAVVAILAAFTIPSSLCARRAGAFFRGDIDAQRSLGNSARRWLAQDPHKLAFHTGSRRFDGEWYLILHMAAALGFAQTSSEHSELAAEHLPWVIRAIERMLLPEAREHDYAAWHEDPLKPEVLEGDHGHLAYLAYANLALSVSSAVVDRDRALRFRSANEAITDALARRYASSTTGILESYPAESYPADNAVALASIHVFDRAAGTNHRAAIEHGVAALATRATDPASGLLYQRVDSYNAEPRDAPRASGTAMAAFALGYADSGLAERYWKSVAAQSETWLGFGGIREYPEGIVGNADIDSGPLILGLSISASGFALASARRAGDRARYRALFASTWLFGLPRESEGTTHFTAGGTLGDVLLFALLTARRPS